MKQEVFEKLNLYLDTELNEFHAEKLANLIEDENVSVGRFRYLCSIIASAEKNNKPNWLPKCMEKA